jgi:hypothetical protein
MYYIAKKNYSRAGISNMEAFLTKEAGSKMYSKSICRIKGTRILFCSTCSLFCMQIWCEQQFFFLGKREFWKKMNSM